MTSRILSFGGTALLGLLVLACGGVDRSLSLGSDGFLHYGSDRYGNVRVFVDGHDQRVMLSWNEGGERKYVERPHPVLERDRLRWCGAMPDGTPACAELVDDCKARRLQLPASSNPGTRVWVPTSRGRTLERFERERETPTAHPTSVGWRVLDAGVWTPLQLEPSPETLDEVDDYWIGQVGKQVLAWDRQGQLLAEASVSTRSLRPAPVGNAVLLSDGSGLFRWTPGSEPEPLFEPQTHTHEERLHTESVWSPAWRPDGTEVLFYSTRSWERREPLMAAHHWKTTAHVVAVDDGTVREVSRVHLVYPGKPALWVPDWVTSCLLERAKSDAARSR